jgi:hypothetical protein
MFFLGNFPASEFYMPTFRNNLFHLPRQVGVERLNLRLLGYPYGRNFGSKIVRANRKEGDGVSFLLAQAIFEPKLLPYGYPNILKFSHSTPICL